ncbi:MAG: DEAD/DEAH box helicase [Flavobacteriaceae bacterium]|nr:DEAD/DEAH box helicase [Flavobacteriaceae bacterium]
MTTFKSLGLNAQLLKAVENLGFESPTEVQHKVIPILLENNTDLVALAQTGTGKTAAFGFPILQKIDTENRNTQGLIISPTRELCLQITNDMTTYGQGLKNLNIVAIYGGASITEQAKKIKRGAQIIVATPGRLKDMIKRKMVNIRSIEYCVLDEADEMLNMGFYEDIKDILKNTPNDKDSWLFSATMPPEVNVIAKKFMHDPKEITIGTKNSSAKNISHQYYIVGARERYSALRAVISLNTDIFGCVFCRTKIETQKVADKLIKDGYKAAAIHGDLSQNQRDAVMQSFRKKKIQLLIATDVAARGIDVDDITHVINYQLPDEIEIYTHRSGRTGRAGKQGTSVIFVTKSDQRKIRMIENKLQTKLAKQEMPSVETIFSNKVTHWINQIKNTPVKSDLNSYLSKVIESLKDIDKETLIELMLSYEFKNFDFSPKLNDSKERNVEQRINFDRSDKKINAPHDKDRFFINVGARDQYEWQTLKDFLRSFLKLGQDDVFQVEVMKNFSFFSTHKNHRDLVLKSFENLIMDERKVNVELTKKGKTYSPKSKKKKSGFKKKKFR